MESDFKEMLKMAKEQLTFEAGQYEKRSDTDAIYELAQFANDPVLRPEIIKFIQTAFDILREDAKTEKYPGDAGLVNQVIFGAVGRLAGMIDAKELAHLIYKEFQFAVDNEQHYELNLEGGTLAITLSLLEYEGEIKALDEFLKSYEYRYVGEKFIMETRYALWVIKQDGIGALEYLKDTKGVIIRTAEDLDEVSVYTNKSLGYVAAALADLNARDCLSDLEQMLEKIKNPVTKEIFNEAIARVKEQKSAPMPKDRMIQMFGRYSSTELVLGQDSDNEFILRARNKTNNKELGNIREADESAASD